MELTSSYQKRFRVDNCAHSQSLSFTQPSVQLQLYAGKKLHKHRLEASQSINHLCLVTLPFFRPAFYYA